jgi:hypothetical protein
MVTQLPRPELSRATTFNWIPQQQVPDPHGADSEADSITLEPMPFVNPVLEDFGVDADPSVAFVEGDAGITGGLHFPLNRFATSTIERLGRNYPLVLKTLIRRPDTRVKDLSLL